MRMSSRLLVVSGFVFAAAAAFATTTHLIPSFGSSFAQLFDSKGRKAGPELLTTNTTLTPFASSADTGEKPQSKVWKHDGRWFAVMPSTSVSPSGTWVWRLEPNNTWTNILQLSSETGTKSDAKSVGDTAYILMHDSSPSLVSIAYDSGSETYSIAGGPTAVSLPGSETASFDIDSTGRMWIATENGSNIVVYHSAAPYASFSGPITLANNVDGDDISAVIAIPGDRVGVLWSNQNTQRFGFRIRNDADDPTEWAADEVPASASALNIGAGMADDHINLKVAADGTLYAAVKTSYDSSAQPKIALLVRRPNGTWDPLYNVDTNGTRAIALLNESTNKLRVVYTASEGNNDILYKESDATTISFGPSQLLIDGSVNNVTSTKANWSDDVVVLASNGSLTHGVLIQEDGVDPTPTPTPAPGTGLVAHWTMDELSGTTVADTGDLPANNGTTSNSPTFTPGKYGNALALNGTNQYATVTDEDSLDLSTGMTIAAWIKPSKAGTQNILKKTIGTTTANGYELSLSSAGKVFVRLNGNANYRIDSTTDHPTSGNEWMHVAATLGGGVIRLYVNGIQEGGDKLMPVPIGTNTTHLRIGRDTDTGSNYFGGQIDDLRLYDRGLSPLEIASLAEIEVPNTAPIANAGADQTITLPADATLSGTASDDGLPASGSLTTAWSKVSGFGTVSFADASALSTTASFSDPGVYVLRLTANDGELQSTDDVIVTVNDVNGMPPPLGHWRVDEGVAGSDLLDSSGSGLHATTVINSPTYTAGHRGPHAILFNGTDQRTAVTDNELLDLTGPMTMALWVKVDKQGTQHIFKKGTGTDSDPNAGYEISIANGTQRRPFARFRTTTGFVRVDANEATYPAGVWMHLAAVHDGTNAMLYVNGVLQDDVEPVGALLPNDIPLGIGAQPSASGTNFFGGELDDVRLYGSALSQQQILHIMADPAVNLPPIVDAGVDQTVTFPATADLVGSVSDDDLPAPPSLTTTWSKVSGPGTVSFDDDSALSTTATFSGPGIYVLRLTANDGVLEGFDEVRITVNDIDGLPPVIGHWKMDDDGLGPQLTDFSGNGLHGTLLNGPTFVPGQVGTHAVDFDGTDDRAEVPDDPLLDITGPLTISLWVRPEQVATQHIFKKGVGTGSGGNAAESGYEIGLAQPSPASTGAIFARFCTQGLGTVRIDANAPYPTNTWIHVVAVHDGSEARLYINGVLQNDVKTVGAIVPNDHPLGIGAQPTAAGFNFLNGQMDDVRLYGVALTQEQITQLATTTPVNTAPDVSAGDDQVVTLPNSANLAGSASDDGLPNNTLITTWDVVSGPGTVIFGDASSLTTTATFSVEGNYVLSLTADDGELQSVDLVQITVNPEPTGAVLVGHWPADEGSGLQLTDLSGQGNNAVINGDPVWSADCIQGPFSIDMDGSGDYALAADSPTLNITSAITMAAWIKPAAYGTQDLIKKAVHNSVNGYELALAANDASSPAPRKPFVRFNQPASDNTYRVSALSDYPIDGSWMHLAATWDGTTIRLYVNGIEEASAPFAGPIASNTLPLGIGGQSNGARTFNGQMDDIRLYSTPLSAAEIAELANRPPTVDAGIDQTGIILPAGATLDGTVTDDGLSGPLTAEWSQISGPGTATFVDASAVDTTVNFDMPGTYVLRLTANDGVYEAFDEVSITAVDGTTGTTVSFQYGSNGYLGTVDTFLSEGAPDTPHGALPALEWDENQSGTGSRTALIRFDDIFGNGPGQIPPGVYITSATLNYNAFDEGDSATVNEVLADWDSDVTYNDFGGDPGIQPDEYSSQTVTTAPGSIGANSINVTASLQAWNENPTLNRGWIFRPNGTNGTDLRSSDYATVNLRPSLTVTYSTVMPNLPPSVSLVSPANGSVDQSPAQNLTVSVTDPNGDPLTVTYYGREASVPASNFTIIALPDTQNYSGHTNGGLSSTFTAQTQWIVDQRAARNIIFVTQLGDCVQNGNVELEWQRADSAISLLENPVTTGMAPFGIPYGIAVGNHDQTPTGDADGDTTLFNQYFGADRFAGRPYYGGHYGTNNDNHYQLFSASGMDFIIIHLEYDTTPDPAVLAWANNLLASNPTRRGIIVSHYIVNSGNPGSFSTQGQAIYNALRSNPNLFMMLSGHVSEEGRRSDTFNGSTVHSMLSDYQSRPNGGNGWLRILTFKPASNEIDVQTYSPTLDAFETDPSSQFTLPYDMSGAGAPFTMIGSNTDVESGSDTARLWNVLAGKTYEWYVTVSDGTHTVTSPVWTFTTQPSTPTSAPVSVTGRVQTSLGRGISRVYVTLTDGNGSTRTAVTNTFGYFSFSGVPSGQSYIISGQARGYAIRQQFLSLDDNIDGLILDASQN